MKRRRKRTRKKINARIVVGATPASLGHVILADMVSSGRTVTYINLRAVVEKILFRMGLEKESLPKEIAKLVVKTPETMMMTDL